MGMDAVTRGDTRWFVLGINPEPWAIGPVVVGRKAGNLRPFVGRNQQLAAFQEAVRDELGTGHDMIDGAVDVTFYFWRRRSDYTTPQAQRHRKHDADLTNLQKACEDALQKILFENDKAVSHVESFIMDQGPDVEGKIVIEIKPCSDAIADAINRIPVEVQEKMDEVDVTSSSREGEDLGWGAADDEIF